MKTPIRYRTVMASSNLDKHGDIIMKEALEGMMKQINEGPAKMRLGVDHRRDFPPRGRIENAEVVQEGEQYYLLVDMCEYTSTEPVSWDTSLISERFEDQFTFAEIDSEIPEADGISFDRINFPSRQQAEAFVRLIEDQSGIEVDHFNRKAEIPDPEIVIKLVSSQVFLYLIKPTLEKIGEKIYEKLADRSIEQGKRMMNATHKILKEAFAKMVPKAKPVTVVFDFPGKPHIELLARTRDDKLIAKAFSKKRIEKVKAKIDSLSLNTEIAKIQFILTSEAKWQFNYLITSEGETIGTKASFHNRNNLLKKIDENSLKRAKKQLR